MYNFPERLKDLRTEMKMSQEALSKAVGFSQQAIGRWENNERVPNAHVLISLSRFFKVSIDFLVGEKDYE